MSDLQKNVVTNSGYEFLRTLNKLFNTCIGKQNNILLEKKTKKNTLNLPLLLSAL